MAGQDEAIVFNMQRFCLHDGPGIRTTVFLKGCPLRCRWCDNPESMNPLPELGFAKVSCNKCGRCVAACPTSAIGLDQDGMPLIDRERCTVCGECVAVCAPDALAIYGTRRSVAEVLHEVRRDEGFFDSDGGVTFSGGEPLRQSAFVATLFKDCRDAGISTALETCGLARSEDLREVLTYTDVVMYDLKHLDSQEHRRLTGQPNTIIIDNARLVAASPAQVQFRMPLIPGLNDSPDNLKATAEFIRALQDEAAAIELMPYHRLGIGKYQALGRAYPLEGLQSADSDQVEAARQGIENFGVRCIVSR